jgi:putative iron-only hydrogenase system regulator
MEKRIGVVAVLVTDRDCVSVINSLLSEFSDIIIGRQGIPLRDKGISIISLVVEGDTDMIGALTGKIGRCKGAEVKSILTTYKEKKHE